MNVQSVQVLTSRMLLIPEFFENPAALRPAFRALGPVYEGLPLPENFARGLFVRGVGALHPFYDAARNPFLLHLPARAADEAHYPTEYKDALAQCGFPKPRRLMQTCWGCRANFTAGLVVQGRRVTVRPLIHLYPNGLANIILSCVVEAKRERPLRPREIAVLVRVLNGEDDEAVLTPSRPAIGAATVEELFGWLAARVMESVYENGAGALHEAFRGVPYVGILGQGPGRTTEDDFYDYACRIIHGGAHMDTDRAMLFARNQEMQLLNAKCTVGFMDFAGVLIEECRAVHSQYPELFGNCQLVGDFLDILQQALEGGYFPPQEQAAMDDKLADLHRLYRHITRRATNRSWNRYRILEFAQSEAVLYEFATGRLRRQLGNLNSPGAKMRNLAQIRSIDLPLVDFAAAYLAVYKEIYGSAGDVYALAEKLYRTGEKREELLALLQRVDAALQTAEPGYMPVLRRILSFVVGRL